MNKSGGTFVQAREEAVRLQALRAQASHRRKQQRKLMEKRTTKGQPVMRHRMEKLLAGLTT